MANKTAFDYENDFLIAQFAAAVFRSDLASYKNERGASRQTAEADQSFLCGVLLARLEGAKPPMNTGDIVQNKESYPAGKPHVRRTVKRAYYMGKGVWHLTFTHDDKGNFVFGSGVRHLAENFELVPAAETCATT